MIVLAKDTARIGVTHADFFLGEHSMAIITGDEDGVLRTYDYDPHGAYFYIKLYIVVLKINDRSAKQGRTASYMSNRIQRAE